MADPADEIDALTAQALGQLKALKCDNCGASFEPTTASETASMMASQLFMMARVFGKPVLCESCAAELLPGGP